MLSIHYPNNQENGVEAYMVHVCLIILIVKRKSCQMLLVQNCLYFNESLIYFMIAELFPFSRQQQHDDLISQKCPKTHATQRWVVRGPQYKQMD